MSAPWGAPLWAFVFARLPTLLPGIRWDARSECYVDDLVGREFRVFESEPWQMVFASGQRMDCINWLAAQRKVPRLQIVRAFEQAMAWEAQPATVSLGENPYQGRGAEFADAGTFAQGGVEREQEI